MPLISYADTCAALKSAADLLRLPWSTVATSLVFLHRFKRHQQSSPLLPNVRDKSVHTTAYFSGTLSVAWVLAFPVFSAGAYFCLPFPGGKGRGGQGMSACSPSRPLQRSFDLSSAVECSLESPHNSSSMSSPAFRAQSSRPTVHTVPCSFRGSQLLAKSMTQPKDSLSSMSSCCCDACNLKLQLSTRTSISSTSAIC